MMASASSSASRKGCKLAAVGFWCAGADLGNPVGTTTGANTTDARGDINTNLGAPLGACVGTDDNDAVNMVAGGRADDHVDGQCRVTKMTMHKPSPPSDVKTTPA